MESKYSEQEMERLLAAAEQTVAQSSHKSPSIAKLATALAAAQGEMKHAAKSSENPFFKSKYADLAAVMDASRPSLTKNGLAISQTSVFRDGVLLLVTTLMHTSGEWIRGEYPVSQGKTPQEQGSATTYARRYCWAAICGVAAEDDDGNAASQQKQSKPAAKPSGEQRLKTGQGPEVGDLERRKSLTRMLLEMCDHDKAKAQSKLKYFTAFTGRDGNIVDGVEDSAKLSGKRLDVTLDKVRKEYEVWKQQNSGADEPAPDDTDDAPWEGRGQG